VAGTPQGYDFDAPERRFELAYSTSRPGGGRYRLRADTQVFLPRRHYPRGYDVRVKGAQVVSRRNARRLRLRTCRRRARVELTVTPGSGRRQGDCRVRRRRRR
jgi:endoglycosylceramidase